jgi:hypothetical protein
VLFEAGQYGEWIAEMVMASWEDKACSVCRRKWETGEQPSRLGISLARNAYLKRCDVCGTHWEQRERYADTISAEDAAIYYPDFFENQFL